ncbi:MULTISPECIES: TonB-dependent receptor [unclassified Moraxella]|uniref:TonB-dependent receptor n=1 Tax=unclassified Moraxella TaxID=2685852 RepID=UPI003AF75979
MRLSVLSSAVRYSLAISGLGLFSSHVFANTEPMPEATLDEIVVTASADASKTGLSSAYQGGQVATGSRVGILGNQSTMETPFATTAYTNDYLKDKQTTTLGDALKRDSGVRVARGFGNFQDTYFMRGFITYADQTMFNGLYGILPRQQIATPLFERVEVLRGASAMANGATPGGGNVGGTVSLLPKRAGNEPLNEVTVSYGAGNRGQIATDIARRFGEDDAFGVRVNALYGGDKTAVDDEASSLGMASVGVDYRQDNLRVSSDLGYQNNELDRPRPSVTLAGTTTVPKAPNGDKNWAQPWTFSNEKDVFGTLRAEYDVKPNLTTYMAYGFRNGKESNATANLTVNQNNGDGTIYRFDNERKDQVNTGEIGVKGKFNTANVSHQWAVSANAFKHTEKGAYLFDLKTSPSNLYQPTQYANYPFLSAFASGDMKNPQRTGETKLQSVGVVDTMGFMQDKLQVTLGARHQSLESTSYNADTQAETAHYDESKITPMAGVLYKLNPSVSLYANYTEGLAEGDRSYDQTATNYGIPLAPKVSKQTEIGAKYDSGVIGGGIALFNTKQPRAYLHDNGNGTKTFGTYGENQHQGVELNVYGSPTHNTRLLGGLSYINAEQKDTGDTASNGKDVIGVPKLQGNIGLEYDVSQIDGLTLTGDVLHTGKRYADANNTLAVDGATTLNLGARYQTKFGTTPVTLRGDIENVTDKNYWSSVGGYPGQGYLNAGQPRTVKLSASFKF